MIDAATIAASLGGRKVGASWVARCPAHDDHEPSLSIRNGWDGKVLIRCHAGCDQKAVIDALRGRSLWASGGPRNFPRRPRRVVAERRTDQDDCQRSKVALAIWQATKPAIGTLIEAYLATRGLKPPLPETLRFHAWLRHPSGGIWPAMVALVTRGFDGTPLAIHRTFVAREGGGKAPVYPQKMMLGPCRGGAVRLASPYDTLMVGEGIETCLAAMQATGRPAWAALSTSGLRELDLPEAVQDVILLADGDGPGEMAAQDAAQRWKREGRRVRIARPPRGFDFNDVLLGRVNRSPDSAA